MTSGLFTYSTEKYKKGYTVVTLFHTPTEKTHKPVSVSVAPELGSNMFSFIYGGHELIFADSEILEQAGFTGTYVLFPTPNRVKDFTYTWKGKEYVLQKNGKKVDIHHQLVYDQRWSWTHPKVYDDYISFTTSITIDTRSHLFAGFPFPCRLALEYRLFADRVHIQYMVTSLGKEEVPFGFGLHPHFARLSGNEKTMITIPARSFMDTIGDTLLPSGKLLGVKGTPADLQRPTPVGNLNLDHVFTDIVKGKHATVDYTTLGLKISLLASPEFTHIVCWSGHLEAICIENQTCSTDAHNLWARGFKKESHLMTVALGATHTGWIEYKISS